MPLATAEGARIHWAEAGRADAPALVLLHGVGADHHLFDAVTPLLAADFRVIGIDLRGHGQSGASEGDYTMKLLAEDVLAVMDAAGIERAHVCGVSLGGMVAMRLALLAPERIGRLLLCCTSAYMGPEFWGARVKAVREQGLEGIADAAVSKVLSADYAAAHPDYVRSARDKLAAMSVTGYTGCGAAIRDMDLLGELPGLAMPVLVMAGARDEATPFRGHGDRILAAVPRARAIEFPTGHWACVEDPDLFARTVRDFASPRA